MKYLRKYNESTQGNLDFETFKEIMYEISDTFKCEFFDHSSDKENGFYDCHIHLPTLHEYAILDDAPYLNYEYLDYRSDVLPPFEELENTTEVFNKNEDYINNLIDEQIDNLSKLKNDIDTIISNSEKIKNMFKSIQDHVLPRFESYNNYLQSDCGFDSVNCVFRITFEIV